jgi:hypothetical protein
MVGELAELPRFSAYLKYAHEEDGKQVVRKEKIQTRPLPPLQEGEAYQWARIKGHFYGKTREEIEEEISNRRENKKPPINPRPPPEPETPESPPNIPPPVFLSIKRISGQNYGGAGGRGGG